MKVADAQFIDLNTRVNLVYVSLGFVRQIRTPDLVVDASAPQFVLDSNAERMEANLAVIASEFPLVEILMPEGREADGHREKASFALFLQFVKHGNKIGVQWLGALTATFLEEINLALANIHKAHVSNRINARLTQADAMLASHDVTAPKDGSVWLRLVLNAGFQFGEQVVGQFNWPFFLRSADPQLAAYVVGRIATVNRLLHYGAKGGYFEQRSVVAGFVFAATRLVLFAPLEIIKAVLPGQVPGGRYIKFIKEGSQGAQDRPVTNGGVGFVLELHGDEGREPRVPFFILPESWASTHAALSLLQGVFGFEFLCLPVFVGNSPFKAGAKTRPFTRGSVAMGQVIHVTTLNKVCHAQTIVSRCHIVNPSKPISASERFEHPRDTMVKWCAIHSRVYRNPQKRGPFRAVSHDCHMHTEKCAHSQIERIAHAKGFRVTPDGTVIGLRGLPRKCRELDGYLYFIVSGKNCRAHRLQAFQRFGEAIYQPGNQVRHKDGNRKNNTPDNLILGTQKENEADKPIEVRQACAVKRAKLLQKYDILAIRAFHAVSKSYKITMAHFGIKSTATIHQIMKRKLLTDPLCVREHHILHKPSPLNAPENGELITREAHQLDLVPSPTPSNA